MKEIEKISDYSHAQGVYGLLNIVNDKIYVGSSCERRGVAKRLNEHKTSLRKGKHSNSYLQKAWDKHGEGSFQFVMIEEVELEDMLVEREQFWMDQFKSHDKKHGYNICKLAYSSRGRVMSEETKSKISEANLGRKRSKEFCELMSKMKKGNTCSKETRKKLSEAHSGENHWLYGKTHSDETIEKMRYAKLGKKQSSKSVENRSQAIRSSKCSSNSGYKGVSRHQKGSDKWIVMVDGRKYAGLFDCVEEAALNYDYHMKRKYGDNCYLNFPDYDFDGFVPKKEIDA